MNKFIDKMYKYMNGRYGVDDLYRFLLIICLIIVLLKDAHHLKN